MEIPIKKDILPNEGEHIIDYQNRQIALRNRALKIQSKWRDLNEPFDEEEEPIVI